LTSKESTKKLASYAVKEEFERIPPSVVDRAKQCLLDTLACSFGGSQTEVGRIIIKLATQMGSSGNSTILGASKKAASPLAAMVNSTTANALDYDDTFVGHPGATISPPALAVGEHIGVTGKDLITSIVVGYEVSTRIGISIQPSADRFNQVWGLGTWQVFGAAAAVGKLLRLSEEQMTSALGIAGANAPVPSCLKTVLGPLGEVSMVKNNYAMSSFAGVTAALLAKDGFAGPRDILDGNEGFWVMAGSDRCDFDRMIDGLGTRYGILDVAFKPYPTCRWLHSSIDAALQITKENRIKADDIRRVRVRTMSMMTKKPWNTTNPRNMMDAQFSLPYSLAVAMSGIKIGHEWFASETLQNPTILRLSGKIGIEPYDEADKVGHIDGLLSNVELEVDGRKYTKEIRYQTGHPKNPVTIEARKEKFLNLATPLLGATESKHVMQCVEGLDQLSNITKLTRLFHVSQTLARRNSNTAKSNPVTNHE
jgi:2-methylcitrate dehydratase PrpD